MPEKNTQPIGYKIFLTGLFGISFWILHPFAISMIAGLMMAVASNSFLMWLNKKISHIGAALLVTGGWFLLLLGPVLLVAPVLEAGVKVAVTASYTPTAVLTALEGIPLLGGDISAHSDIIFPWLVAHPFWSLISSHADMGTFILRAASGLVIHTALALLVLFVLLANDKILTHLAQDQLALLIGEKNSALVMSRSTLVIKSVMQGTVSLVIWDGVLGFVLFQFFGINQTALWAVALGIASLVPMGTGAILLAASAFLVAHSVTQAVLFLLLGQFVSLLGDMVIKPKIIGAGADAPFLLVLLSIIGGVEVFGLIGLIAGPVVVIVTKDFLLAECAQT
uniref:AI-2E family transporter n=1 Tax=mine drainage metagenome TaxID=410659 RepID=E6QRC7_9ZZZZ